MSLVANMSCSIGDAVGINRHFKEKNTDSHFNIYLGGTRCNICQIYNKQPPVSPLHPWGWQGHTWHRIYIDYVGPFEGRMILIIVDAHSKYIDAHVVSSATTSATITKLRQTFAVLGLPITVSYNGSCFTSDEFEQFCKVNGIKHVKCSPYHPSSNGLAERAVQTVKAGLKKTTGNLEDRLCNFLTRYRVTPQSTTGQTPAEFVLKTPPRTRIHRSTTENFCWDEIRPRDWLNVDVGIFGPSIISSITTTGHVRCIVENKHTYITY